MILLVWKGEAIRVEVDEIALRRIRIGVSHLWEIAGSLSLLRRQTPPWPYQTWYRAVQRDLRRGQVAELLHWVRSLPDGLPQSLFPVPLSAEPTFAQELAAFCSSGRVAAPLPPGGVDWLAQALTAYWDGVIRPYWPTIRPVLHEDLLRRAHLLATLGADAVLSHLDDRCRWQAGTITLAGSRADGMLRCSRQLVIVTVIFGRGATHYTADDEGRVAISCQARGAAVLDKALAPSCPAPQDHPNVGDRLAILVGRSRADLLRALSIPTTTSLLAASLGLSASTVSEHLSALVAAGVVVRHRRGSRVLYELDRAGKALLGHLGSPYEAPR
jgi:DNA-binding transcriptional ArsR family regulator